MSADYTITCNQCGTLLPDARPDDDPETRAPCPNCGSTNRNVSVSVTPGTIQLKGSVVGTVVSPAEVADIFEKLQALMSEASARTTVAFSFNITAPQEDDPRWRLEVWRGDALVTMASGESFDDVYLAVAEEVRRAMNDEED